MEKAQNDQLFNLNEGKIVKIKGRTSTINHLKFNG